MAKRSVHLAPETEQYMTDRTPQAEKPSYSVLINNAFYLLGALAKAEEPELTTEEWAEIYNVYAGSDLTKIAMPLNIGLDLLTHYGVATAAQLDTVASGLLDKLAQMTQLQQFAVIDAARVFWASGCE